MKIIKILEKQIEDLQQSQKKSLFGFEKIIISKEIRELINMVHECHKIKGIKAKERSNAKMSKMWIKKEKINLAKERCTDNIGICTAKESP